MARIEMRRLIAPFIVKFSQEGTLSPYFVTALYQQLFRTKHSPGLAKLICDKALVRCNELEEIVSKCPLPQADLWSKEPLKMTTLRLFTKLSVDERRELGSLLFCYLHGNPPEAVGLWWKNKIDVDVEAIINQHVNADGVLTREVKFSRGNNPVAIDALISSSDFTRSTQLEPKTVLALGSPVEEKSENVIYYRRSR